MRSWLRGSNGAAPTAEADGQQRRGRIVEVGWLVDAEKSTFVYDGPRPVARKAPPPSNAKAVDLCPAIVDHEARLFEVCCPVDMHLRLGKDPKGKPTLVNVSGAMSPVASKKLGAMVYLMGQDRWRDAKRPVLQVSAPWRFIADEPVYLMQLPPFNHYRDPPLPGLMVGGRFPIHLWPRSLMWAFEWWDTAKPLILRRGEPWFYVRFETEDPSRPVRLVEAEMTAELREYCDGLDGVTNYVNQSYQLFNTAKERRPGILLKKKQRD